MPSKCSYEYKEDIDDFKEGDKCTKNASYGFDGTPPEEYSDLKRKRERCADHRIAGMVNPRTDSRMCTVEGCAIKRATFYPKGNKNKKPLFCEHHSEIYGEETGTEMVSTRTVNSLCIMCKKTTKTWGKKNGKKGEKKTLYCSPCARSRDDFLELEDKVTRKCNITGCITAASRGFLEDNIRLRCKLHKESGMICLTNTLCEITGCITTASFGEIKGKPTRCKTHNVNEFGDVTHFSEWCEETGCETRASHASNMGDKPLYCSGHSKKGMFGVVGRMCKGCNKVQGSYGEGHWYCVKCASSDDNKYTKGSLCDICDEVQSVFNEPGETKGKWCAKCGPDTSVDVVNRRCKKCSEYIVLRPPYLCAYCNPSPYRKVKEDAVNEFFKKHLSHMDISREKAVYYRETGRGHFRVDFLFPFRSHNVIVEVDEYQHKRSGYTKEAEFKRMKLIQKVFDKPCIFIRFNPDGFQIDRRRAKDISDTERLFLLYNWITFYSTKEKYPSLSALYICYDGAYCQKHDIDTDEKSIIDPESTVCTHTGARYSIENGHWWIVVRIGDIVQRWKLDTDVPLEDTLSRAKKGLRHKKIKKYLKTSE